MPPFRKTTTATLEGRLRDKEHYKGRWWDHLLFAILEHEWHAAAPHSQPYPHSDTSARSA